jgi:hypothetical protein
VNATDEFEKGFSTARFCGWSSTQPRSVGALLDPDAIKIWRLVCGAWIGKSGDVVALTEQIALDSHECRLHRKVSAALEKVRLASHALPR